MNLTNGNIIYGRAGIASVITYTINGTKLGTGTSDQVLVNGQLSTINKAIYSASSKVTDIHTITLVNTSNSEVSGIVLFLNGTEPINQIIGELSLLGGSTAILTKTGWNIINNDSPVITPSSNPTRITNIDTSIPNITYIGKAEIGTLDSEPSWQIRLIDETTSTTTILYADGTDGFIKVWNNRLTYTYS